MLEAAFQLIPKVVAVAPDTVTAPGFPGGVVSTTVVRSKGAE